VLFDSSIFVQNGLFFHVRIAKCEIQIHTVHLYVVNGTADTIVSTGTTITSGSLA